MARSLQPNNEKYEKKSKVLKKVVGNENYREHFGFSLSGDAKNKVLQSENKVADQQAAYLYMEALSNIKNNDPDGAIIKLMAAIDEDPHQIEFYLALDMVLGQTKQWQPIINYWQRYLALYPSNSRAHYEIMGTYHHNKEQKKSSFHLQRAAELGHAEAIKIIKSIKGG